MIQPASPALEILRAWGAMHGKVLLASYEHQVPAERVHSPLLLRVCAITKIFVKPLNQRKFAISFVRSAQPS